MKEDNRPLMVSIWCITYNHEPYIRQCLDGFVMQKTNFRFEAIVHDDASTDGTAAIVREYAEKYPDIIKPIFETENQYSKGDGSLDRIFQETCKGKYTALFEGDDYWIDPLKLQKQVDFLECYDDYTLIGGNANIILSIIAFFLNSHYSGKLIGYSSWMQIKDISPSYGIAILISVPVYFFKNLPISNWIILPIQICTGVIVFFVVCRISGLEEYVQIKDLVITLFRNKKD